AADDLLQPLCAVKRAAVVRYSRPSQSSHQNQIWCQIHAGEPIHSPGVVIGKPGVVIGKPGVVIGKIGSVGLIRKRISEEGNIVRSQRTKVTLNELAEYVSPKFPEAETKFLKRLNSGRAVSMSKVSALCQKLLIDVDDIAFAVPTAYTKPSLAPDGDASLWAEPWDAWVDTLDEQLGLDVPEYNIYFTLPANKAS
ncbi:MAG TPA: hypothetical protein VJ770_24705, partial [Stellaceae bacterium]|nr:hypothetical protein [Stellaceae bacterium]